MIQQQFKQIVLLCLIAISSSNLPVPRLNFFSPRSSSPSTPLQTSSIRFEVEISMLAFPFLHNLELQVFEYQNQDDEEEDAENQLKLVGTISKKIAPGADLHSASQDRKKKRAKAKEIREMLGPAISKYAANDDRLEEDEHLYKMKPELLEFLARGLQNGKYKAICTLKRRVMQSDVGINLPDLIPLSAFLIFHIQAEQINVKITHLNHVHVASIIQSTLFSTIPSVLLNFSATLGNAPFQIPQQGSLSIKVDGQQPQGPIVAYSGGTSVLIGMLSNGPHLIELAPVDSVEGKPILESAENVASVRVIVQPQSRSGGVDILEPKGIVDDGSVVLLKIRIKPDREDNDFIVGEDGYVRVQLNNNTEHRTFSHPGPYKIQNVAEGIHHLEVLLVDMYRVPIITLSGEAAVAVTKFAFKPDEEEQKRRRQIRALERQAVDELLTGGITDHNNVNGGDGGDGGTNRGTNGGSNGDSDIAEIEPPKPEKMAETIDFNAKRRQLAVSAIGDALRAGEITKPQWTTLKKMIKADRNEANEDFRESYYESQSWSLWVKNMMLELDTD